MWLRLVALVIFLGANLAHPVALRAQQQSEAETLTNSAVIKLVRAGFSDKALIAMIGARACRFDLSADRLIELKKRGVSEKVILAMVARAEGARALAERWGDEAFDDDEMAATGMRRENGARRSSDPDELNIFGSSGGVRGRTRNRSGSGSSEGETQTTGSATVRIIRPPAEAGGVTAPKLEKTPTLTNESIIDLVQAGFSEGTILRRIELSPAEFDLSPVKLAELRRQRVSERVIAAMTAAMKDEPLAGSPAPSGTPER